MDATLNNGAWSEMEDFWKEMAQQERKVEIDIQPRYPDATSLKPHEFIIEYKIEGQRFRQQFSNTSAAQDFVRPPNY